MYITDIVDAACSLLSCCLLNRSCSVDIVVEYVHAAQGSHVRTSLESPICSRSRAQFIVPVSSSIHGVLVRALRVFGPARAQTSQARLG